MSDKTPAQLTVAINTSSGSWFAAAINTEGDAVALIRAEAGYLSQYAEMDFDEQVSFLRHRLAGILQLGCDRMWARKLKPSNMTFLVDAPFAQHDELTQAVADHFVEWMTKPAVTFYVCHGLFEPESDSSPELLAGDELAEQRRKLDDALTDMQTAFANHRLWELAPPRKK